MMQNTNINLHDFFVNDEQRNTIDSIDLYIAKGIKNQLLSVQWLASQFSISERQLLRDVKENFGISTSEYIIQYKLRVAKQQIISNPKISIKTLSKNLLFNSSRYFSQIFRKKYGCNPSQFLQLS